VADVLAALGRDLGQVVRSLWSGETPVDPPGRGNAGRARIAEQQSSPMGQV
jgi:hypothetical protein